MDAYRFDTLTRALSGPASRRALFGTALASGLGALGRTRTVAKKKACSPCKRRKQGKCKGKKPDGTACGGGTCQNGSCIAAAPPPGGGSNVPSCVGIPNDTACNGDGRCLNGTCNARPSCVGASGGCTTGGGCCSRVCCTGSCAGAQPTLPNTCLGRANTMAAPDGSPCLDGRDCFSGSCIGYRCLPTI